MKQMAFEIPVGKMPAKKKRWWQFWRKKGDSAEEALADLMSSYKKDYDWKNIARVSKINCMFGLVPIKHPYLKYQKEYWFPSTGVDNSILRMTRIENIFKK